MIIGEVSVVFLLAMQLPALEDQACIITLIVRNKSIQMAEERSLTEEISRG